MQKPGVTLELTFSAKNSQRTPQFRAQNYSKRKDEGSVMRAGSGSGTNSEIFEELFDLCKMSGIKMDRKVYRILVELVKQNIHPDNILEMMEKMQENQTEQNKNENVTDEEILQESEIEISLI